MRGPAAVIIALFMLVQSIATGWAGAMHAQPTDMFGNPLCHSGTAQPAPDGGGEHGKLPQRFST